MVSLLRGRSLVWMLILMFAVPAWAGDAVPFSGVVKKVIEKKMKVSVQDPETKKRFTIVLDDKSKLNGYSGIAEGPSIASLSPPIVPSRRNGRPEPSALAAT